MMKRKHKLHCIKQRECCFHFFYDGVVHFKRMKTKKRKKKNPPCIRLLDRRLQYSIEFAIPFSFAVSVVKNLFCISYISHSDVISSACVPHFFVCSFFFASFLLAVANELWFWIDYMHIGFQWNDGFFVQWNNYDFIYVFHTVQHIAQSIGTAQQSNERHHLQSSHICMLKRLLSLTIFNIRTNRSTLDLLYNKNRKLCLSPYLTVIISYLFFFYYYHLILYWSEWSLKMIPNQEFGTLWIIL